MPSYEEVEQMRGLLWAVIVWFGNGNQIDHPYVARDVGIVNAWCNKHDLTDPSEGRERFQRAIEGAALNV